MFVSTGPAPTDELPIQNGTFWPIVDLVTARSVLRLDGTVTTERLRHSLIVAMGTLNAELRSWRQTQLAAGYSQLVDVPADQIDNRSVLLADYLRAVYSLARAELIERYRDYDVSASGQQRADVLVPAADDYRRDARQSVRRILGLPPSTIELI